MIERSCVLRLSSLDVFGCCGGALPWVAHGLVVLLPVPVGTSWRVLWWPSPGGCVLSAWCGPCCSSIPRIVAIIINPL